MNITIIGAGKSGIAAAKLAKKNGEKVFVSESGNIDKFSDTVELLNEHEIDFEFGENSKKATEKTDLIITSPGVPPNADIMLEADKKGIPVISELEYGWNQLDNPFIAITGTNGKTTTTALIEHILKSSGKKAIAAGNIGNPVSNLVGNIDPETIIVSEVSSYQLDRCNEFAPETALILNITPDHLGYHGLMENYISSKLKISSKQIEENFLIYNADDEVLSRTNFNTKAQIIRISMTPTERGIFLDGGLINHNLQHKTEEIMHIRELSLPGEHNVYNSMAAAIAARTFEITNEDIRDSLMTFAGVEHRLEKVRDAEGILYVNDSKATNINAAWYALRSYDRPIIWIAGGRGDNNDYSYLDSQVEKSVKAIVAIGEEKQAIFNHFSSGKRCLTEDSLESAVEKAKELADFGDVILFAPACKSFDMFANFEQRGTAFKNIVNNL